VKTISHFPQLPSRKKPSAILSFLVALSLLSFLPPAAFHGARTEAADVSACQGGPLRRCILPPTVKKGSLSGESFVDRLIGQLKPRSQTIQAAVLENVNDPNKLWQDAAKEACQLLLFLTRVIKGEVWEILPSWLLIDKTKNGKPRTILIISELRPS
jgi:hypothetical protein